MRFLGLYLRFISVIVNNAGIGPNLLPTHKARLEDWDRVIAVNQTGVFYCMKKIQ